MTCSKPNNIKGNWFACGCCRACRITRSMDWGKRVRNEVQTSGGLATFATLTYDDETLPPGGSLRKTDLQKFIKRLRSYYDYRNNSRPYRYIGAGEYGTNTLRPHYHLIICGLDGCCPSVSKAFEKNWPMGITDVNILSPGGVRYLTDYLGKDFGTRKQLREKWAPLEPPFQVFSQGLGRDYCDKHAQRLKENLHDTYRFKKEGLPAYYRRRLELTQEDFKDVIKEIERKEEIKYGKLEPSLFYGLSMNDTKRLALYEQEHHLLKEAQIKGAKDLL